MSRSIRVGVTGHRLIARPDWLAEATKQAIAAIRRHLALPEDEHPKWVIVSSLADGADRIVARTVLNMPHSALKAILPFPADEYRRDFGRPEDRADFDELLAVDPQPVMLTDARASGKPGGVAATAIENERGRAYLAAGHRLVEECDVLIAVWNGKPAAGLGGTGDVVAYAQQQGRPILWINADEPHMPPRWLSHCERAL